MEVEGLTEDMIFEGSAEENRMWQCMRDHSACMRRLYADIYQSAEMYSFIYGTRPQSFYEGQTLRCYTPEAISSTGALFRNKIK